MPCALRPASTSPTRRALPAGVSRRWTVAFRGLGTQRRGDNPTVDVLWIALIVLVALLLARFVSVLAGSVFALAMGLVVIILLLTTIV